MSLSVRSLSCHYETKTRATDVGVRAFSAYLKKRKKTTVILKAYHQNSWTDFRENLKFVIKLEKYIIFFLRTVFKYLFVSQSVLHSVVII